MLGAPSVVADTIFEMSVCRVDNLLTTILYISSPVLRSGNVTRAVISSHTYSPLQNREDMASLADDVMPVLS